MSSREEERIDVKRLLLAFILLLVMSSVNYLIVLNHEFVYDDHGQLEENLFLKNPAHVADVLMLKTLADKDVINGRRPLVLLTYFSDRALWGGQALGYRLTNLIAHVFSVWLLYLLLLKMVRLGSDGGSGHHLFAFIAALFFGMHPVLTEAVHVPAFRPDIFYSMFLLAYLLSAMLLTSCKRGAVCVVWIFLSTVLLGLALCSKEAAVSGPVILAGIWLLFPSARPSARRMGFLLVLNLLLILIFMKLSAGSGLQAVGHIWNGRSLQHPDNLMTSPWLFVQMLWLCIYPWPLIADRIIHPVASVLDPRFAAGVFVVAGSVAVAVMMVRRKPWISLGLGWMLVAFLPVSNLVPLFNPLAERYIYFIAMGFAILAARLLLWQGGGSGTGAIIRKIILAVICTSYFTLAYIRLPDWQDDSTLWSQTLQREPESARAHVWVGLDLKQQGRVDEAVTHFTQASKINPQDVSGLINRAVLWGEMGYYERAEADLLDALARRPASSSAHWNLAVMLQFKGDGEGLIRHVEKTLALNPWHYKAMRTKVALLVENEQYDEAMKWVERMREIDPSDVSAESAEYFLRERLHSENFQ